MNEHAVNQFWSQRSLLTQLLMLSGAGLFLGLIVAWGLTGLVGSEAFSRKEVISVSALVMLCTIALIVFFVRITVVQRVRGISLLVSNLARAGDLQATRRDLERLHEGRDLHARGDEITELVNGLNELLVSQEHLASQARAIAKDDLWNDVFENRDVRGDQASAFREMLAMLRDLSIQVNQIAQGDLTGPGEAMRDRVGNLGSAFAGMTEKLKMLIERLGSASAKIDGSGRSLQSASRDQAASATQQAAAITETMATMEELAASSGHIADIAKNVVNLADESLKSAQQGNQAVGDVGAGMDEIVLATQMGAQRLLDLGEKSRSIGKVADLITGIAEQSKFLALNAAIEAARAGEAGRGFSVVADEVRNLANHIVESTSEIEGFIGEIQSEINAAVLASEEGVKRAEHGRELSRRAQDCLTTITGITKRSTDAARQIELATNQQRSASTQVATAVREVAGASEEVASGAKRVTGLSNELAALGADLQSVIRTFEGNGSRAEGTPEDASGSRGDGGGGSYDLEALRRG